MTINHEISFELFEFLRELEKNNNKEWFSENKQRFREVVQNPMLNFIENMSPWLKLNAPSYLADVRLNGGSLFRIYRDTRFSSDKSPYKTNVGCNFRHRAGKDVHAPGFYVHISPNEIFFGGGIWKPPTLILNKIRDNIVNQPDTWREIVMSPEFVKSVGSLGNCEMLMNTPRGYSKDHPLEEDLRRKSYYAFGSCSEGEVCSTDFQNQVQKTFGAISPMMQFITNSLNLN